MSCQTGETMSALAAAVRRGDRVEIHRMSQHLHSHREIAESAGTVTAEQSDDPFACLNGLYPLLCLHFV